MNKAIFLDRDGVLNRDPGYLHRMEDLEFYPGVIDALIKLSQSPYQLFIVTNQPGIGRGLYTAEEYMIFEKEYLQELKNQSNGQIRIEQVYHCPHHPTAGIGKYRTECNCRKPATGMLEAARKKYDIDMASSFMVGDKRSDIQAGHSAGCKTVLVKTGCGGSGGIGCEIGPDYEINQLVELPQIIGLF